MRIEYFQYIIQIADYKSISKAAKALFITQPTLSMALHSYEEELGFKIFDRSNHGVILTEKGEQLYEIAKNIEGQLAKIKHLSEQKNVNEEITIAAVPAFCNAMMIDLIKVVNRINKNLQINIYEDRPLKIIPVLASGEASIGIGNYSNHTKKEIYKAASLYNITIEPIFEDYMVVFLNSKNPLSEHPYISMEDLENETPIYYNDYTLMEDYDHTLDDSNSKQFHYCFSDRANIKKAVAKGLGYAILPSLMTYDDIYINSGIIKTIPLEDSSSNLTIYLSYSSENNITKSQFLVLKSIRNLFQKIKKTSSNSIIKSNNDIQNSIFY